MSFLRRWLTIVFLVSLGHATPRMATAQSPLKHFQDANFGVRFSHSHRVSTSYNPHGCADYVFMYFKGESVGGLVIHSAQPAGSVEEFVTAGKEQLKRTHRASSVSYALHENPHQYEFHHFRVETTRRDEDYVIERYVYLHDKEEAKSEGSAIIAAASGAFTFEFFYRKEDEARLSPEIGTIVNSFRIEDSP